MGACAKGIVLLFISVICATEAQFRGLQHRPDARRPVCARAPPCCPGHVCRSYQQFARSTPVAACARTLEGRPMYRAGSRAQRYFCGDQRSQPFGMPGRPPRPGGFPRGQDPRFGGRNFEQSRPRMSPPGGPRPPPSSRGPPGGFGWGNNNDDGVDWNDRMSGNRNRQRPPGGPRNGAQWGSQADQLDRMLSQQNVFRGQQTFGGGFQGSRRPSDDSMNIGVQGGQFGGPSSSFNGLSQSFRSDSISASGFTGQGARSGVGQSQTGFGGNQASFGSQSGFGGSQQIFDGESRFMQSGLSSQGQSFSSGQQPSFGGNTETSFGSATQPFGGSSFGDLSQGFGGATQTSQQSFGGIPQQSPPSLSFGDASQQSFGGIPRQSPPSFDQQQFNVPQLSQGSPESRTQTQFTPQMSQGQFTPGSQTQFVSQVSQGQFAPGSQPAKFTSGGSQTQFTAPAGPQTQFTPPTGSQTQFTSGSQFTSPTGSQTQFTSLVSQGQLTQGVQAPFTKLSETRQGQISAGSQRQFRKPQSAATQGQFGPLSGQG